MNFIKGIKKIIFKKEEPEFGRNVPWPSEYLASQQQNIKPTGKRSKAKFEIFQSKTIKAWFFRLKAPNGQIIAQSEGYTKRQNALKGIEAIKKHAPNAKKEEIQ